MNDQYQNEPVLRKWVNPYYLRPNTIDAIRESSLARPYISYAVLDNFFNEDVLDEYLEKHKKLRFYQDEGDNPYDAFAVVGEKGKVVGSELFYHKAWHMLCAEYTGTLLAQPGEKTLIKQRAHKADSKGFWIHSDRTEFENVSMAVLVYLNRNWNHDEGHMLQLWSKIDRPEKIDTVEYSWKDFKDKRLDFLDERYSLTIDLPTGLRIGKSSEPSELFLFDQITPEYNRLVLVDFIRDPAYHSVTPGNGRVRFAILQWLF